MATTFTGYAPYGTYQAPYPIYPIPPGQHMAAAIPLPHFAPPGYPLYALQPAKPPSPPHAPPTAPDIPTISLQIASSQVQKLIVSQLKAAQFDSIDPHALQRLELEVVACKFRLRSSCLSNHAFVSLVIRTLYEQAHEYANLANRAAPVAMDVLLACSDRGLKGKDLHHVALASQSAGQHSFPCLVMLLTCPRRTGRTTL